MIVHELNDVLFSIATCEPAIRTCLSEVKSVRKMTLWIEGYLIYNNICKVIISHNCVFCCIYSWNAATPNFLLSKNLLIVFAHMLSVISHSVSVMHAVVC